ncbi:hypothetical protein [Methylotuvimicrobium sp. KM2]|uniref:hypothetical protein n=1 Tax=Methylotuvimicrobium sp. KM2 TaxID=3133976 RepID=UPI0031015593
MGSHGGPWEPENARLRQVVGRFLGGKKLQGLHGVVENQIFKVLIVHESNSLSQRFNYR